MDRFPFFTRMAVSAVLVAAVFLLPAKPAHAETPKQVWDMAMERVSALKDYKGTLHLFTNDTAVAVKYRPSSSLGKPTVENWYTYEVDMVWKEPGYSYIKIMDADTPGIDFATKHIKEKPGTEVVFGYRDSTDLYGKFPKTGRPDIDKMIAKNIFHVPAQVYEGARPHTSFNESMKSLAQYRSRYFQTGTVSLESGVCELKRNFKYDPAKDSLSYKPTKTPKPVHIFTLVPNDVAGNLGISKEVICLDPDSMMPIQLDAYEDDKMVFSINLENLEINTKIDDSLWEEYFKDTNVIDQGF